MYRGLSALMATLLCSAVAIAPPARAAVEQRLYVISATTSRLTPLVVDLRAESAGDEGFAAVFGHSRAAGASGVYAIEFGAASTVRVGAGGMGADSCAAGLATCAVDEPGTFTLRQAGSSRLGRGMSLYVAVESATVELTVGPGLRARLVKGGFRRVVGDGTVDVAHAGLGRLHAARFTEAELPGGRRGSVAVGAIPCEQYGAGDAALLGDGSRLLSCGSPTSAVATLVANAGVHWRLSGETTGVSVTRTRLAVIDLL